MKTYLDCYPCFLRQALVAARLAKASEPQQKAVLDRVLDLLKQVNLASTPPEIGERVHRIVRREVGDGDPYRVVKETSTYQALALYTRLKTLLAEAGDPLEVAVRLSIAGNIIDLAAAGEYDLWGTVERVLTQPFAVDDRAAFRQALSRAGQVLYLADNAGETVFDRLLIETLHTPVVYAVKGGPVLNDATWEDALAAGVDQVAEIASTGLDAPGTILERCSDEFRRLYDEAEIIIAKGQANYETLSEEGPGVFFLLQTKCLAIARDVGVPVGSIVLKQGQKLKGEQRT
ncbi:MAG: ARMT1-like domain-containing protein [Chloroflexota bacterium]|nr:ARMT1-like domain-containing protein [Chloroflexota bacterium]